MKDTLKASDLANKGLKIVFTKNGPMLVPIKKAELPYEYECFPLKRFDYKPYQMGMIMVACILFFILAVI